MRGVKPGGRAERQRVERYRSHTVFRTASDYLHDLLRARTLSEQDLYDAVRVAIDLAAFPSEPLTAVNPDGLMATNTVLPMEEAPFSQTAALSVIPVLWRKRHDERDGSDARTALRGWIRSLRRTRSSKGYPS